MNIREERMKKGMSQKTLAALVGVVPATISLWETGRCNPTQKNRERIEAALFGTKRALTSPPSSPESGPLKRLNMACDVISYVHLCLSKEPGKKFRDLCDRLAYAHGCLCQLKILPVGRRTK